MVNRSRRRVVLRAVVLSIALVGLLSLASSLTATSSDVGGLTALYPWPEGQNLISNPSFEDVDPTGSPRGWSGDRRDHVSIDTATAKTGERSARILESRQARYATGLQQTVELPAGWYTVRAWARADDVEAGRRGGGRITVKMGDRWTSTPAVAGTTEWVKLERRAFQIPTAGKARVLLEPYRRPTGTLHFDDIELRREIPPVVEGFVLYPNYRGVLFEDRPQTVRVSVHVRPEEAGLALSDIRVLLTLEAEGQEVARREALPTTARFEMTADASTLPLGTYTLRIRAVRRETSEPIFEYPQHRIVKVDATVRRDSSVYVDPDNALVLDGRRRFVLGIYDTTGYSNSVATYLRRLTPLAGASLDFYINYWIGNAPVRALEALTAALRQHDMWYLHTVNTWRTDSRHWAKAPACDGLAAHELGPDRFTACMATALGGRPAFAGWYTADEAPADRAPQVFHQYRILRSVAPTGIAFIAQNKPGELIRWRDAADVFGVDPYPLFWVPADQAPRLELVTDWVEQAQEAVERSRPVWAVIQYFQGGGKSRWPTEDELRSMSYMAIASGAKGLFYWSYGAKGLSWVKDPDRRADLWQRLVRVTREIRTLEPVLLAPDAPDILAAPPPPGILVLPKHLGDDRYLITVNNTPKAIQATFTLAASTSRVEVVPDGRAISSQAPRSYTDEFAPYAARVYRLRKGTAN